MRGRTGRGGNLSRMGGNMVLKEFRDNQGMTYATIETTDGSLRYSVKDCRGEIIRWNDDMDKAVTIAECLNKEVENV